MKKKIICAVIGFGLCLTAQAVTGTWNLLDGNWTDVFGATVPQNADDVAIMTGNILGNRSVTNNLASLTLGSLQIGRSAATQNRGITLSGNAITFTNTSGAAATITKISSGASTLNQADAINTDIILGVNLAVTNAHSFGPLTLGGTISEIGTRSVTFDTTNSANAQGIIVTGNNTYSGGTTIKNGKVTVGNGGATGSLGSGNIVNNGTLVYNRTGTYTNDSIISGSGALALTTGTLVLSGDNTYSGGFTANGGTIKLANVNGLGTGAVTFNGGAFNSGANLQDGNDGKGITNDVVITKTTAMNMLSQKTLFSGQWSGTNTINVNGFAAGNLILTGDNSGFSGPINMVSAVALVAGHNNALGTGAVTFNTGGKQDAVFRTIGDRALANNINVGISGTNSLTISITNSLTLSGVLSGDATVIKAGSGALTLTGANTYTNATTISDGVLVVDGSLASALITLNAGTTLKGTGTVQAVTLDAGAILAAGNSPGTLTFAGDVLLSEGSTNIMEITDIAYDILMGAATNTLTMSGVTVFDFTGFTGGVTNGYTLAWSELFQNWGATNVTGTATYSAVGLGDGQSLNVTADGFTVIPEPATIGMLGLGALITMMLRRMRTR